MAEIFKIATVNINGIKATGRMRMLHEFIQRQELDIILLQEVTHHDFEIIQGYDAFLNVGTNRRGQAFWHGSKYLSRTSHGYRQAGG